MKKRDKHYWNYRIVTKVYKYEEKPGVKTPEPERLFSITEVYYKDGKPDSYIEGNGILNGLSSKKELKWIHKKMKKAFKRPILDLDNWPKKYIPGSTLVVTNELYS